MHRILEKSELAPRVHRYLIQAPDIARKAQPGQFVILRLNECGERIPITIADMDPAAGTLTLYIQVVGKTTLQMSLMSPGDGIRDVVGPLGVPSVIEPTGTVMGIGGGFGIAALYPILRQHQRIGNRTISVLGARSKQYLILEDPIRAVSDETYIATDDGSYGTHGLVTDVLNQLLQHGRALDLLIAIGPLLMMQTVCEITRVPRIKTLVSMNPIMMDGTGMCGACRLSVAGQMRFACVDGPEFDGHEVDFKAAANRLQMYLPEERIALERFQQHSTSRCPCPPAEDEDQAPSLTEQS